MPIFLHNYIKTKLASLSNPPEAFAEKEQILQQLLKKMLSFAPSNLDTRSSSHYSSIYQQKIDQSHEITSIMSWIVEKIFHPILLTPSTIDSCLSFWKNQSIEQEETQRSMYIVHGALVFSSTGLGNCAKRSSYAAFELFDILKDTGLAVKVHSWAEIDQYVVMIGNDREGWKIYDPLTNPFLLFDQEEYVRDIKSLFKPVPYPKRSLQMTINTSVVALYNFQLGKILRFLSNECSKTRLELLRSDLNYHAYLNIAGIADPFFQKTQDAYNQVCALLGWEDPQSLINNGLT